MIYYYAALVITYSMTDGTQTTSYVWFDRERHCWEAMQSGEADALYDRIYNLYDDVSMTCHVSNEVSYILKAKLRPEEQKHG